MEEDRNAFDENLGLARTVAPYIENHNFFVEHRHHTVFWKKMREFGDRLVEADFLEDREDMFYMNRWEIGQALYEAVGAWAAGGPVRGMKYWRCEVEKRKQIIDALRAWTPESALGPPPEEITEAYRFDPDAGEVRCTEVKGDEQDVACLSDEEVVEVAKIGKQLESLLKGAQDVEWAIGPGESGLRELFLLQTRPETVWSQKQRELLSRGSTSAMDQMASMFTKKDR